MVGQDYKWVNFWLDGAITYPDARLLAFNLDIREIDQFQVDKNFTVTTDLELIFQGIENKDVRIESSNFHFKRIYNQLTCNDFPDVNYIPWTSEPETITNIDLDFSTTRSRMRYDSSLILLALVIEYPIIRIGEFYKDWRDEEKGKQKKKKATSKTKNYKEEK